MKVELTNATELGMPEDMIGHCKQLLERRIRKIMTTVPATGTEMEILYSDKDPLGTSDEVDDQAYFIYFTIESAMGDTLDNAVITAQLVG